MAVRTVTWVAQQVPQEQLIAARSMATALGLEVLSATTTQLVLRTERGDVLEYCDPTHPVPEHLFTTGATAIGFEVDDLLGTGAALDEAGFQWLTDVVDAGPVRYRHFRGPGDLVYALIAPGDDGSNTAA